MHSNEEKQKRKELWEVWSFRIVSAAVILLGCVCLVGLTEVFMEEFPFPKLYANPVHYFSYLYFLLPMILCSVIFCLYVKPREDVRKKKRRKIIAKVLMVLSVLSILNIFTFAMGIYVPPMYLETDNPEHYLQLGTCQDQDNTVYSLFPAEIPDSAEAPAYYYFHDHVIDPVFELHAGWTLPKEEFEAELQRKLNADPIHQEQIGNWTCLHFTDYTTENAPLKHYNYRIFAYNEEALAVRYIASYAMDNADGEIPYFMTLEW